MQDLKDKIPTFGAEAAAERSAQPEQIGLDYWSALTSIRFASNVKEALGIIAFGVLVIGGAELAIRNLPSIFPSSFIVPPSTIFRALVKNFVSELWPHVTLTLQELAIGFAIGASIGLILAAILTQMPFVEKLITPYVILMVTTPMLALIPLLQLKLGFGIAPKIVVVAMASGPMVMINSATGFRRTDLAKIALARSYGANTLQIFLKVRFPLALPMIIVGLMVGSIFGLLTAVGAEMVGGDTGLGSRLTYFSNFINIPMMWATIVVLAFIGVLLYLIFFFIGRKWASWES
jgi:NitT/TauT family transport system permease protein